MSLFDGCCYYCYCCLSFLSFCCAAERFRPVPPSSGYTNTAQNVLLCLCSILRPDSTVESANVITAILENHGSMKSSTLPDKNRSDLSEDILMRVFANKLDEENGGFTAGRYQQMPDVSNILSNNSLKYFIFSSSWHT